MLLLQNNCFYFYRLEAFDSTFIRMTQYFAPRKQSNVDEKQSRRIVRINWFLDN